MAAIPGTWNSQHFSAVGEVLWCVWSVWCLRGPQEFLFACSSHGQLCFARAHWCRLVGRCSNAAVELPSECQFVLPLSLGTALYLVPHIAGVQ